MLRSGNGSLRGIEKWDQEVEADSKTGKLDFLVEEAFHEKHQGRLKL